MVFRFVNHARFIILTFVSSGYRISPGTKSGASKVYNKVDHFLKSWMQ